MKFQAFEMERWQSTYEHAVRFNLSESGVEPLTLGELVEIAGLDADEFHRTLIEYNPSDGSPALRAAIADMYAGAMPGNVLVTNGGSEANFVITWLLCDPGDELLYVAPTYMQVPGMAANWGCTARPWHLREDAGWQPDPDELSALVTDATKLI
ncbi:MAG: aminotransferase class I/II-fold pyridoxal phosphate-dependent enzyme, partial [Acidobacteria bacterium]|nr:aminotransferase class I/II-fold pyridoxal phosphate-dependent enzyme [Acidobacteriota bacterium]